MEEWREEARRDQRLEGREVESEIDLRMEEGRDEEEEGGGREVRKRKNS